MGLRCPAVCLVQSKNVLVVLILFMGSVLGLAFCERPIGLHSRPATSVSLIGGLFAGCVPFVQMGKSLRHIVQSGGPSWQLDPSLDCRLGVSIAGQVRIVMKKK